MDPGDRFDVIVVGAGAAGVGVSIALIDLGITNLIVLERGRVGDSFARWPAEMRFITPSFPGNAFGQLDLNAVALRTSPAFTLGREHPSGREYARYLRAVADHFGVPVATRTDVRAVVPEPKGFRVETSRGPAHARHVIWAAGEFQYPALNGFPGADLCRHTSQVRSWTGIEGDDVLVIGGYESGIDAAVALTALGKRVRVLDRAAAWSVRSNDPSVALSPYTRERLQAALERGGLRLVGSAEVARVERTSRGHVVTTSAGKRYLSPSPPILATGFVGSLRLIPDLFEWTAGGHPVLTPEDESTRVPGLFLVGPTVRHGAAIFCFIYKFRQRFAVVAAAIGARLGRDLTPLDVYRAAGLYLDDLTCCGEECAC